MDHSDHGADVGRGHGWLQMIVVCGLMLIGLLVLSFVDTGWGAALIVIAFVICPLAVLLVWRAAGRDRWWRFWRRPHHEQDP